MQTGSDLKNRRKNLHHKDPSGRYSIHIEETVPEVDQQIAISVTEYCLKNVVILEPPIVYNIEKPQMLQIWEGGDGLFSHNVTKDVTWISFINPKTKQSMP